jgi:hypothetical protein
MTWGLITYRSQEIFLFSWILFILHKIIFNYLKR